MWGVPHYILLTHRINAHSAHTSIFSQIWDRLLKRMVLPNSTSRLSWSGTVNPVIFDCLFNAFHFCTLVWRRRSCYWVVLMPPYIEHIKSAQDAWTRSLKITKVIIGLLSHIGNACSNTNLKTKSQFELKPRIALSVRLSVSLLQFLEIKIWKSCS